MDKKETIFTDVFELIELDTNFLGQIGDREYLTHEGMELICEFMKERTQFMKKMAKPKPSSLTGEER